MWERVWSVEKEQWNDHTSSNQKFDLVKEVTESPGSIQYHGG